MHINRKRVNLIERMANKYRHRQPHRVEDRNALQVSKAQHPSRTRSLDRANASLEAEHD
jgi:hypothetical protein